MNPHLLATTLASKYWVAESGTPEPTNSVDPNDVAPGMGAFVIAFLLALVVIVLIWSMTRHLRRVQVRGEAQAQEIENEEAALAAETDETGASDTETNEAGTDGFEPQSDPDDPEQGEEASENEKGDED